MYAENVVGNILWLVEGCGDGGEENSVIPLQWQTKEEITAKGRETNKQLFHSLSLCANYRCYLIYKTGKLAFSGRTERNNEIKSLCVFVPVSRVDCRCGIRGVDVWQILFVSSASSVVILNVGLHCIWWCWCRCSFRLHTCNACAIHGWFEAHIRPLRIEMRSMPSLI